MLVRTPRELGAFVRDARTQRRLTQAELAKQVGVSRSWVIDLEAGKRTLEIGLVLLVLETLEIRLELSRVVSLTGRASAKSSAYATLEVAPVEDDPAQHAGLGAAEEPWLEAALARRLGGRVVGAGLSGHRRRPQ